MKHDNELAVLIDKLVDAWRYDGPNLATELYRKRAIKLSNEIQASNRKLLEGNRKLKAKLARMNMR